MFFDPPLIWVNPFNLFAVADTAKFKEKSVLSTLQMGISLPEKTYMRKPRYTQIVALLFIGCTLASGLGIVILDSDYFSVFDTANRFIPRITRFTKSPEGPGDSRNLTLYLSLANPGSRRIFFIREGDPTKPTNIEIRVWLNDRFISTQEIRPDLILMPGSDFTLLVNFTVDNLYGSTSYGVHIAEAEESGVWNWEIQYPMRIFVEWLYIRESHLRAPWSGIEEVPAQ